MPFEPHERARLLLDQSMVDGISADDRRWLDTHLEECAECSRHAELSTRTVRALDAFAFDVDPTSALRVQNAIRRRAERLAADEAHARSILIGAGIAALLAIGGSFVMWQPVAWLAERWNMPSPAWQIAFAMLWLLPSLLAAMLPVFRSRLQCEDSEEGETV